ncbi:MULTISPECIES: hypothetical protein [unclassified Natrinema]|uniref:Viral structural protein VP13 n=1 Tax=Saline Natrinema sp. J7-1 virus 2 TaxID=2847286 RepID=A0A976SFC0_9VIRU|nr:MULTISPECIES: hypothetical protein [unclassified Natrinema]YP_010772536.1 viral structural protein VP13 [Saline Natrinema sp. J7-1 virus 2]AFO55981.1 hypothetical protein NJ7G_0725 [Natrinema sp. J7-2]UUT36784.1 viral structural protein VP13 [Saline Natrinema sp. J7-1 virus 2]
MAAHRPIVHGGFAVMLTVLLVGSLLAPIAATGTVAAQTDSTENKCMYDSVDWWIFSCTDTSDPGTIDADQAASEIEADIHTGATGIDASRESTDQVIRNYLNDTGTIASLEGRNQIADSYEAGEDPAVADTKAQQAINDYYATKQITLLEETSAHTDQLAYYANVSQNNPNINDDFVHFAGEADTIRPTRNTSDVNVTLANGSVHTVTLPEIYLTDPNNEEETKVVNFFETSYENESEMSRRINLEDSDNMHDWFTWYPSVHLLNTGSLKSKQVYDYRTVVRRFDEITQQSDEVVANYPDGTAQDFYTALDNGDLETKDLRGAEGMVRYLSGDADVTDERYQYALRSVLDMDRTSLNSTMVVDFTGATERTRNVSSDGSVTYEYNSINKTYEGLLFSSETPESGFETGVTYDVSNLNGTQRMVTGGADGNTSDVKFYRGKFTITEMTDGDGNQINQTELTDRPEYGTFNATEYQRVTDKADSERSAITSTYGGSGDGILGGAGGWLPENGSGDMWLAAAFLIAIIAIVASAVTNLAGELGP